MHGAVRRVGKRRGRGCLLGKRGSGRHGVGEYGNRNAVGVTAQVRDGPCPTVRRKMRARGTVPLPQDPTGGAASPRSARISGAEDCAPPGESPNRRQPSPFARSGGTVSSRSGKISGAEDCTPPGGRSPAKYSQSSRTATLCSGVNRRMGGYGGPCPSRGIARSRAPQPICQVGRDSVIAVRENIGRRGLRPSRAIGKPRAPWDICQSERDCELAMRMGRGRRTGPFQSYRRTEGILGHPLIRAVLCVWGQCPTGTEDCAPPTRSHGMGLVPAVRRISGTEGCAPPGVFQPCAAPPKFDRVRRSGPYWGWQGAGTEACTPSSDCTRGARFCVCSPGSPCLCGPSGGRKLLAETLFEKNAGAVLTDSVELVQGGAKSQLMLNLIGSYAVGS
jgi:hypothetical protein